MVAIMMTMAMVKAMVDIYTNALLILILNNAIMHYLNKDDHDDGDGNDESDGDG